MKEGGGVFDIATPIQMKVRFNMNDKTVNNTFSAYAKRLDQTWSLRRHSAGSHLGSTRSHRRSLRSSGLRGSSATAVWGSGG